MPLAYWLSSWRLAYSLTDIGVLFNGWPNGEPADKQEVFFLDVMDSMRDEVCKIHDERKQKAP